ncbi:MAG: pyruvate kinase [Anaerolineae bacterium]|nr:pyruvate kinase [Anaerolineae bacterium]MDK1081650.1 pyruvate kinase [Anaerolineae bacterium]MDK1118259.1 pyruvate kinase [Anaerolineae bacterium]
MNRKAKIVATIGPASDSKETLEKLIKAGINVARLNFSHGTHATHAQIIANIRSISERLDVSVGILQDLQGPKIRIGSLDNPLQLNEGESVTLYSIGGAKPESTDHDIPVDFRELFISVKKGDRLLLDDGRLSLEVEKVSKNDLNARVLVGGLLTSHKGINVPGVRLRTSGFTSKDKDDLSFGISHKVDAVAISFVRTAEDVIMVRTMIDELAQDNHKPLLIAKLERPEALDNMDEIMDHVDGVMVARGDLGVELPPERVPVLQKQIIEKANKRAKLVITATQMLETMIDNPLPTRAEASDVANAIFDGTDAVMLSAETASGKYPVEVVEMMARIIEEAESHFLDWGAVQDRISGLGESDAASMARAAYELAHDRDVAAVTLFTIRGTTAWLMSKIRPAKRILAFTPEISTYRKSAFLWGIYPQLVPIADTLEEMIKFVDAAMIKSGIEPGQQVVLVCGFPVGALRPPNMALLHTVGE